MYTHTFWNL